MTDGILSGTVEVQCGDLSGPALDWAVAKVEGVFVHIGDPELGDELRIFFVSGKGMPCVVRYLPSTDWRFGGPMIEKYQLCVRPHCTTNGVVTSWAADTDWPIDRTPGKCGSTPLIAACRAIVAAHLGEVVSVPAELT